MKVVAAALAAATLAGGVETSDLRYTRAVEGAGGSHVSVEPDGPMFEHARVGFADLRVVDGNGEEVPWRTRPDHAAAVEEQPVLVLNSGRSGGAATVLLDLGPQRAIRDRIVLDVPDRDFVGRAVVSGADRRAGPFTQLGATGIYDVSGAQRARSTTAVFPATDFRFLQVRATGVSRITGATVQKGAEFPLRVARVPESVSTTKVGNETLVTLDFGNRDVPVDELRITASTQQYDRPVVIEAANARLRGWPFVSAGRISRFEGAVASPIPVGTRARFVRVRIENGDDPPLEGIEVRALSRSHALVLEGGHEAPYTLYYGAPGARAPNYEFARIPLDEDERVAGATLTEELPNPEFEAPGETFGERNRWLVSVALALAALAVGVAGILAFRRRA